MSLFEDDFFSPKVRRRIERRWYRRTKAPREGWKRIRRSGSGKWSTVQVAVVSSIISAFVAVILYSWITGSGEAGSPAVAVAGNAMASDPYERIVQAADKVSPAVVSMVNKQKQIGDEDGVAQDMNLGSGVIFKKDGGKAYVLTNEHVVQGADELEVVLDNGQRKNAELVGKDRVMDVAVLRIDAAGVTAVAEIGDSRTIRRGETVIALGNPLGFGGSLTAGIVGYTNRLIPVSLNQDGVYDWEQTVIQTDAAINEGNSGGALVNLDGQVIGINTMKIATTGVEGLGFAIPINEVMETVDRIMEDGKVVRPYLGVYTLDVNNPYAPITEEQRDDIRLPKDVREGVIVLESSGPAKRAGLKLNDVIVRFDKQEIGSTLELRKYLYEKKHIGDSMDVHFYRDGVLMTVKVILADKPD
ncbi:trypsin-like peptidase domain-containing protein [Paenibacillus melissococcoides]|uniref:Trypsin-like peptidase domain-containing protein n=1 Tax=Paenibacillus melissococcoides TaxID=2912268 RepID=A0ABN8UD35_9BACL|nr:MULTISPECIES: trypsin-like peptidase domain-containing protein [Paenibacillus]MEB9893616.1 trypsin-like peptidase domain-containing protein [Bacillus cereus]CAH8247735.1 trypsin-like peptidase domain-containing protein [Paenibacillus melissococcoides]CAH8705809.1 trypsin-like peptidase domain-containing protein [Paenibacillus melissococcoides]CAH8715281.1 trypsin-like peptidase domain-containing protein [Paenibacillus melissococcoides]GIO80366.1 serine protease [Paenibacillus dendritiformis